MKRIISVNAVEHKILAEFERLNTSFILNKKKKEHGRYSWNGCSGDITSKLFSHYIKEAVKGKYDVSGENSFVEGFPYEFDLLILKKGAKPFKFTSIYEPKDVVFCMELKSSAGPFNDEERSKKYAEDFKNKRNLLREANGKIEMIYLSMKVPQARKEFFERTTENFKPIKCFKICEGVSICEGAWKKLMEALHV